MTKPPGHSDPTGLPGPPGPSAPSAPSESGDHSPPQPATEPADEAFTQICGRLAGFEGRLHAEYVDGYFTAAAASWRTVTLEELLEPMAGDAFTRGFADPEDDAQARAALQARLEALRQALDPEVLLDDPDTLRLAPWMAEWDEAARRELVAGGHASEEEAATLHTGQEWAAGFLQATVDFAADWPDPDDDDPHAADFDEMLRTVAALGWDPAGEEFQAFARDHWKDGDPTREELIDEACFAVQDLRVWWLDHSPRRPPRRVAATPGRNDPCWCGSGRKFKKCHGA